MKTHVVADLHTSPVAARFDYEELDSTRFVRQRLLDKHMCSGLHRLHRLLDMAHRWRADHHHIRLELLQGLCVVRKAFSLHRFTA
jgi:hypothetical protein